MIRLLKVELTRLRCRRAAVVLLIAALVVPIVMAIFVMLGSDAPRADAQARAQAQADKEVARCVDRPRQFGVDRTGDVQAQCEDFNRPEYFSSYNTLDLARESQDGSGPGMIAVLAVVMFLLGTTFVGHDWATGSMSNQLLFEPRRWRVWLAKALAVGAAALVVAAVAATAFWLVLRAAYTAGDVPLGHGVFLDCLQQGWRGAAVASAAAVGGYALTMLSRSTVFTLGVLFGVAVAGGLLIAAVVDDPGPWDPTINAAAVVRDGTTYYVDVAQSCYDGTIRQPESNSACDQERDRSLGQGLTYLVVLLGGVSLASGASFHRRDVP